MQNTLESVIDYCIGHYGLAVMPEERKEYLSVLSTHKKNINRYSINTSNQSHSNPSYPFFNHLADYLILYSYLAGKTPIRLGSGKRKRISSLEDLKLLSKQNVGVSGKREITDLLLARTYGRIQQRQMKYGFPGVSEIIDKIGKNNGINKRFGLKRMESLYSQVVIYKTRDSSGRFMQQSGLAL